ncbi:MAG: hypothetical protein U0271_06020 [Polyangiaceae bacterium]
MARMDAFSAELVRLVRNMSDEAILALVRNQLGSLPGAPDLPPQRRIGAPRAPVEDAKRGRSARGRAAKPRRRSSAAREEIVAMVERIVRAGSGMSASEIARASNLKQSRVVSAIRELKAMKRVFQGGDRRFARYAGDMKTAEHASEIARENASGPVLSKPRSRKKG